MKKMLLATALALLITGCSTDVYCSKQPAAVALKETITHHFFVLSGIGQKKTVDAAKICGGVEKVNKQKPSKIFVNGLLGFITLGIYTSAGSACVLLTILHELPIDMGTYLHAH